MADPSELRAAIDGASGVDDPLAALAHVATVRDELGRWEAMLAREALADGASWATIGAALGTSRQAAWERLRPAIKALIDDDRRAVEDKKAQARRKRKERADG